jgi:hypothetical protein
MSKLRKFTVCTSAVLMLTSSAVGFAQNVSFPSDVTIRRSSNSNPVNNSSINPTSQYLVYIADPAALMRVRVIAPDAFVNSLDSGQRVVQVGRFNNLDFAQKRVEEMRRSGIEAQIQSAQGLVARIPANNLPVPVDVTNNSRPLPPPPMITPLPDVPVSNSTRILPPPTVTPLPAPPSVGDNSAPTPRDLRREFPRDLPREAVRSRYFVIIPSTAEVVLLKARSIVPSARLASTERGTYIEVRGYPDRPSAETLNATMRSQGLDSRVIYF